MYHSSTTTYRLLLQSDSLREFDRQQRKEKVAFYRKMRSYILNRQVDSLCRITLSGKFVDMVLPHDSSTNDDTLRSVDEVKHFWNTMTNAAYFRSMVYSLTTKSLKDFMALDPTIPVYEDEWEFIIPFRNAEGGIWVLSSRVGKEWRIYKMFVVD